MDIAQQTSAFWRAFIETVTHNLEDAAQQQPEPRKTKILDVTARLKTVVTEWDWDD